MGPTCKETQEDKDTAKDVHIERRFFEIVPREEGSSISRRIEPSSESLQATLLSQCLLSLT